MLFAVLTWACTGPSPRLPAQPAAVASRWQVTPALEVSVLAPGVWRHVSWQTLDSGLRYPSNGLLAE